MQTSTWILIQVYPPLPDESTLDVLRILLESRRRSGGGDLEQLELVDNSLVRAKFVHSDSKLAVLSRRFLSFDQFMMIVFDADCTQNGYRSDKYELNKQEIILSGDSPLNIDRDILLLYGENLLPDNEVREIRHSSIFPNTLTIVYSKDIDFDVILARFPDRSKIKNTHFKLLNSKQTNSILIGPVNSSTPSQDFSANLKAKIIDEMSKSGAKYFLDMDPAGVYCLVLVESEFKKIDELAESIRSHVDESITTVELCANFELIDELDKRKSSTTTVSKKTKNEPEGACKSTQTDLTGAEIERMLASKISNGIAVSSTNLAGETTTTKPKMTDKRTLVLDNHKQYTRGLLNAKQMFIGFRDVLKKPLPYVELSCDREAARITAMNKKPSKIILTFS